MVTWRSTRHDDFGDLLPLGNPFTIGLDLGQARDYSAMAVVERTERPQAEPTYTCRGLHRWPLGTLYSAVVADVATRLDMRLPQTYTQPLHGSSLVIDGTGCGRPVVEMFRKAPLPCKVAAVCITGGMSTTFEPASGFHHVPKRDLVSVLAALLHTGRLKIVPSLPDAEVLTRELENFRVKVTTAGNEIYEAWRDRDHDDMVLALAIACWWAERHPPEPDFPPCDEPGIGLRMPRPPGHIMPFDFGRPGG